METRNERQLCNRVLRLWKCEADCFAAKLPTVLFFKCKVKMSLRQGGRLPLHTLKNQSTVLIGQEKIIRRSGELASPFLLN